MFTPAEALHRMVYKAEARVRSALGGIEIPGFRRLPRTRSGVRRNDRLVSNWNFYETINFTKRGIRRIFEWNQNNA